MVADDEQNMRAALKMLLENDGYSVCTASTGREVLDLVASGEMVDLIVTDLRMPDLDGMQVMDRLKTQGSEIPVVFITAYGSIEAAVEAMKKGAVDFITKPFSREVIRHIIRRVFQLEKLESENVYLKEALLSGTLVFCSRVMKETMGLVERVSQVATPVLITGESGSGKQLVAEAIHSLSSKPGREPGGQRPFVVIHCPAFPDTLIESELFGYRRGAFTGATRDFKGKLRLAEGGTLFLDEIGDLPLTVQPKLLRFLEAKTFQPLGGTSTVEVNARVICATNRDLKAMVASGRFREDLFYRINAITLNVPPLRERWDDILPISRHFLETIRRSLGKGPSRLSAAVEKAFLSYGWPGNVRELRNVVERAVVLSGKEEVGLCDIPFEIRSLGNACELEAGNKLEDSERKLIQEALNRNRGNISATARELGVSRATMRYRLGKYGLDRIGGPLAG